jgi:TPR repeat protein
MVEISDAQSWFQRAGQLGHSQAAFQAGDLFEIDELYERASENFQQAFLLGDLNGGRRQAYLLMNFLGEPAKGEVILRSCAKQGDCLSLLTLGEIREKREDYLGSVECYRQAIPALLEKVNSGEAGWNLALAQSYEKIGDYFNTQKWYDIAAESGSEAAKNWKANESQKDRSLGE